MNRAPLADRISGRLEEHRRELSDQQLHVDSRMKELLEQREQFAAVARRKIDAVILPRMEELNRHFDHGKIEVLQSDSCSSCICDFAHIPRFPATVSLSISLLPVDNAHFIARYDLTILPVLMEYTSNAEEVFCLTGNEDVLASWTEDRIIDFIDTYLRLETHPFYQKDNSVLDIVCGMRIPSTSAIGSIDRDGRTFYFCSEHCKEAFIKTSHT